MDHVAFLILTVRVESTGHTMKEPVLGIFLLQISLVALERIKKLVEVSNFMLQGINQSLTALGWKKILVWADHSITVCYECTFL